MNQARITEVFEIRNPSFSDMNLPAQIEVGVNDWCARDNQGREFVGETRAKALANARPYLAA